MSEPLHHAEFRVAFGWGCWLILLVFFGAARIARILRRQR